MIILQEKKITGELLKYEKKKSKVENCCSATQPTGKKIKYEKKERKDNKLKIIQRKALYCYKYYINNVARLRIFNRASL